MLACSLFCAGVSVVFLDKLNEDWIFFLLKYSCMLQCNKFLHKILDSFSFFIIIRNTFEKWKNTEGNFKNLKRREKNKNQIYKCAKHKIKSTNAPDLLNVSVNAKHKINLTWPKWLKERLVCQLTTYQFETSSHPAFTCSKSTMKTAECAKSIKN